MNYSTGILIHKIPRVKAIKPLKQVRFSKIIVSNRMDQASKPHYE